MIRVDSSCFYSNDSNEESENFNDRFQSTISFGGDIQQNIQVGSNQNKYHFSYQNKASLMEIFNCYLKNPQLQYTLNCSSFQGNTVEESSNLISQKSEINQPNSKNLINSSQIKSQQNVIKPKSINLIKFSQIAKNIQAIKSPKNAQKLTFKSNMFSSKQQQNPIKIEDRQNIHPNFSHKLKQNQKPHQKSSPQEFLQLQSKVQWTDKQNETKIKRKKSIKNLSLSRKEKFLSPLKTINPQSKSSNIKSIHSNSIFKDNQASSKMTISGLEFSKKYKKRALKNKSKGLEINSDRNIEQAQFLR